MQDISLLHGLVPETLVQIDKLKLISFFQKEVSSVQHPYQASSQFILKPVIYLHMHVLHKNDYEIKKV